MLLLLPLLFASAIGTIQGLASLPQPDSEKPLVFSLAPELDSQAVRDAWIQLQRDALATAERKTKTEPEAALPPLGVIGVVEPVFVEDIPVAIPARIDTGAAMCSLDVGNLKHFERDGKPWVSFTVKPRNTGKSHTFERRVLRTANIKQHGRDSVSRPIVNITVRIGEMTVRREFSLADRNKFTYQVLLGRNLLQGLALIDASATNTLQ